MALNAVTLVGLRRQDCSLWSSTTPCLNLVLYLFLEQLFISGLEEYRIHLDIYSELLQLFYCYLNVCYCELKVKTILGYRGYFSHVGQVSFSSFCCSGTAIHHHSILYLCQCTKKTSEHCTDQVSSSLMLSTSKPEVPVGSAC